MAELSQCSEKELPDIIVLSLLNVIDRGNDRPDSIHPSAWRVWQLLATFTSVVSLFCVESKRLVKYLQFISCYGSRPVRGQWCSNPQEGGRPTWIEKPGKTFHIRGQSISALDKVGNLYCNNNSGIQRYSVVGTECAEKHAVFPYLRPCGQTEVQGFMEAVQQNVNGGTNYSIIVDVENRHIQQAFN